MLLPDAPGVSNIALSTFTSSALVVWVMQMAKKTRWFKLVEEGKPYLNRAVSLVAAMCANLGLSYTWDPHTHSLTIAGLSLVSMATMLWHFLNHYAMQETIYQMAVNKPSGPSLTQQKSLDRQGAQTVAVEPDEVKNTGGKGK